MTDRYGTFVEDGALTRQGVMPVSYGIIDRESGDNYYTTNLRTAEQLAELLNRGSDCRFNCRARREADYLQGWIDATSDWYHEANEKIGKERARLYVKEAKI